MGLRFGASLGLAVLWSACFFDLGEVVEPSADGGGGSLGVGGATTSSSASTAGGGGQAIPPDWWDARFRHRLRIDFDGVTDDVTDVRVPVVLPPSFPYADAQPLGEDLRFVDADGATQIPHEVERYDPMGSVIWIRVPEVTATDDHVWLYFGRPDALPQSDPSGVWSGYLGVYHFAEDPSVVTTIADSSPNPHDGTPNGFAAGASVEAVTGAGIDFSPSGMRNIEITSDDAFAIGAGEDMTLEVWFKWDGQAGGTIAAREGCCIGYYLAVLSGGLLRQSWRSGTCCGMNPMGTYVFNQANLPNGANDTDWHHAVVIWDRSVSQTARWYIDGQLGGEDAIDASPGQSASSGQLYLGAAFDGNGSFSGILDEMRFIKTIYPLSRIALHGQAARGELLSFRSVESLP